MALSTETRAELHTLLEGGRSLQNVMEKVQRWAEVQAKTSAALAKQADEVASGTKTGTAARVALKLKEAAEALQEAAEAADEVLREKKR